MRLYVDLVDSRDMLEYAFGLSFRMLWVTLELVYGYRQGMLARDNVHSRRIFAIVLHPSLWWMMRIHEKLSLKTILSILQTVPYVCCTLCVMTARVPYV